MSDRANGNTILSIGDNVTWVTLLTSRAPAAIAVIKLGGPKSEVLIDQCWQPASPSRTKELDSIRYGKWLGRGSPPTTTGIELPSEDVVLCWTSANEVEIHCHGGPVAANRILEDLTRRGAVFTDPFVIQSARLTRHWVTDAWEDLERAKTETTTAILLDQARGALDDAMQILEEAIEVGNIAKVTNLIDDLLTRARYGLRLLRGWQVAITGPPNAGKSSLLNHILGYSRAIVHDRPGTTRDVLVEQTHILGWPVTFVDTAGLRETDCDIEAEGVRRAMKVLDECDLILLLIEPNEGCLMLHQQIIQHYHDKIIAVVTKSDLIESQFQSPPVLAILNHDNQPMSISSKTGIGIDALFHKMIECFVGSPPMPGMAVPFREGHVRSLEKMRPLDGSTDAKTES